LDSRQNSYIGDGYSGHFLLSLAIEQV